MLKKKKSHLACCLISQGKHEVHDVMLTVHRIRNENNVQTLCKHGEGFGWAIWMNTGKDLDELYEWIMMDCWITDMRGLVQNKMRLEMDEQWSCDMWWIYAAIKFLRYLETQCDRSSVGALNIWNVDLSMKVIWWVHCHYSWKAIECPSLSNNGVAIINTGKKMASERVYEPCKCNLLERCKSIFMSAPSIAYNIGKSKNNYPDRKLWEMSKISRHSFCTWQITKLDHQKRSPTQQHKKIEYFLV